MEVVILDTEYTCWEGANERNWSRPNEHREIVQIAAIVVNFKKLEDVRSILASIKYLVDKNNASNPFIKE